MQRAQTLLASPVRDSWLGNQLRPSARQPISTSYSGNQAALRRLSQTGSHTNPGLQCKLQIGASDDPLEAEADRVADQVTGMPEPGATNASPTSPDRIAPAVQRKCDSCEEDDKKLQKKSDGQTPAGAEARAIQRKPSSSEEENENAARANGSGQIQSAAEAPPLVHEVLGSAGQPLDGTTRQFFEPRFGLDLSPIRVHTDERAARSARSVNALAYTAGSHIAFANGQYNPNTGAGKKLFAHELAHFVQQGTRAAILPREPAQVGNVPPSNEVSLRNGGSRERPADVAVKAAPSPMVQRFEGVPELPPEFTPELIPEPVEIEPEIEFEELGEAEAETEAETEAEPEAESETDTKTPEADSDTQSPEANEDTKPGQETVPDSTPNPQPDPMPDPNPAPIPNPGEPDEKEKDKTCGSKQLPLTQVTFSPGSKGQAGTVLASPLTMCPGNTRGSLADPKTYPKQFDCIKTAGLSRIWIPGHVLHGQTRRTGARNMHGPGNDKRNVIIAQNSVNKQMSVSAEQPVLKRIYDKKQVLWYKGEVESSFPGQNFFANSLRITWGLFDVNTGTPGPAIFSQPFVANTTPPNCPDSLGAAAAGLLPPSSLIPLGTGDAESPFKICEQVLRGKTEVEVKDGGLRARIDGKWDHIDGSGPAVTPSVCPQLDFTVQLKRKTSIILRDDILSTSQVHGGGAVNLTWRGLPPGTYYLFFEVPGHHPNCCLRGNVTFLQFSAPPAPRIRSRKDTEA